nr:type II secretion system protein [Paraferrimonas haliotis]
MKKQQGFTLIELVVVIIILGILSVVAAPKFINLQKDARSATLHGLKGSLEGANALVFSKAAIAGLDTNPGTTVDIGSANPPAIRYGYLQSDIGSLQEAMDIDLAIAGTGIDSEWQYVQLTHKVGADTVRIHQKGAPDNGGECYLEYTPAQTLGGQPLIEVKDKDC